MAIMQNGNTMDLQAIKAADAELGVADLAEAAAILCAQTQTIVRDVPCEDARSILLGTGEYGAIVMLSRMTPSDTVPAPLIAAAITAVATLDKARVIQATDPAKWAAVQQMVGAFLQASAISQETHDALLAMHEVVVPVWPGLTAGDIQTARNQ